MTTSITMVVALAVSLLVGGAGAAPAAAKPVVWGACLDLSPVTTAVLTEPTLIPRLDCGSIQVPVDYSRPEGRRLTIQILRLRALGEARNTLLVNPGGPGLAGRSLPVALAQSAGFRLDTEVIGVDVRGTGLSTAVSCPEIDALGPDEEQTGRDAAARYAATIADANRTCFDRDPEYFGSLTAANAARDLERVRIALGKPQLSYYGASWGTGLGASYRQQFPERIKAMALDSMNYLGTDYQSAIRDVALAGRGGERSGFPEPTLPELLLPDELTLPELGLEELTSQVSLLTNTTRTAYTCNGFANVGTFAAQWEAHQRMTRELGLSPDDRISLPGSSELGGVSYCTGWPAPAQAAGPDYGRSDAPLLIIGHRQEDVTPYPWAEAAQRRLGGRLVTIDDARHGTALSTGCAGPVVKYLETGREPAESEIRC